MGHHGGAEDADGDVEHLAIAKNLGTRELEVRGSVLDVTSGKGG